MDLNTMKLHPPFSISSRLLPALEIEDGTIQLQYAPTFGRDGRTRYLWTIDIPDGEFSGDDLQSRCGGGNLQEGFESLLAFLAAAGESYKYDGMDGEHSDSFPEPVVQWACMHDDAISLMELDIRESKKQLIEE